MEGFPKFLSLYLLRSIVSTFSDEGARRRGDEEVVHSETDVNPSSGGVSCLEALIGVSAFESIRCEKVLNCGQVDVPCDARSIHVEQKSAVWSCVLFLAICASQVIHVDKVVRRKVLVRERRRDVKVVSPVSFAGGESEQCALCVLLHHMRGCAR